MFRTTIYYGDGGAAVTTISDFMFEGPAVIRDVVAFSGTSGGAGLEESNFTVKEGNVMLSNDSLIIGDMVPGDTIRFSYDYLLTCDFSAIQFDASLEAFHGIFEIKGFYRSNNNLATLYMQLELTILWWNLKRFQKLIDPDQKYLYQLKWKKKLIKDIQNFINQVSCIEQFWMKLEEIGCIKN